MARSGRGPWVWDVPTRLFHWLLVGLLGFSWWTAETHRMEWHQLSGFAICGLIVFRILWGLVGTSTARFAGFLKGPAAIRDYLRPAEGAASAAAIGHNPLGGWSVLVLLLLLVVQVVTGLFAVDIDGIESGTLSYLVDFDQGRAAAEIHELSFNLLLALSALHVLAILFYLLVKRRNLITPMITGFATASAGGTGAGAHAVPAWRLVAVIAVAGLIAYGASYGFQF
jgi:cytochrome b